MLMVECICNVWKGVNEYMSWGLCIRNIKYLLY